MSLERRGLLNMRAARRDWTILRDAMLASNESIDIGGDIDKLMEKFKQAGHGTFADIEKLSLLMSRRFAQEYRASDAHRYDSDGVSGRESDDGDDEVSDIDDEVSEYDSSSSLDEGDGEERGVAGSDVRRHQRGRSSHTQGIRSAANHPCHIIRLPIRRSVVQKDHLMLKNGTRFQSKIRVWID